MKFIDLNKIKQESVKITKPGAYVAVFQNLSGTLTFELATSGIELYIFGLYIGKGDEQFHIETVQRHTAPGSVSDLLIKGVFRDRSKMTYQGLIRLEKEAQQSHAYQKNQNLLLSKDVFVDSRPFLEILANDVFCTHGSTTGKLNEEQLWYARSRGLSPEMAEQMLVGGFIDELHDKIKSRYPSYQPHHHAFDP